MMRAIVIAALVFFLSIITVAAFNSWEASAMPTTPGDAPYTILRSERIDEELQWIPTSAVQTSTTTHTLTFVHEVALDDAADDFVPRFDHLHLKDDSGLIEQSSEWITQSHTVEKTDAGNMRITTTLKLDAPINDETKQLITNATGIHYELSLSIH